jgi:hypothetical protein
VSLACFSHIAVPLTFDNREEGFLPKNRNWKHEDASEMMFDDMMKEYELDFQTPDVEFIKALIAGDKARCRSVLTPMRFELRHV